MTAQRLATLLPLTLILLFVLPAAAQPGPPTAKRDQVEARVKQIRSRVLREQVGLSEAKAKQVEAIMNRHDGERRALKQKLQGHRQALARLLQQDSNDQAAYAREIKGMREARKNRQALRQKEIDELQKVLTPKEQAKLGLAMERMRGRMNQAVKRHRGGPPPRR